MEIKFIDSKNFDLNFKKILREKKGPNVVKGRFDIEPLKLGAKSNFIIHFLSSFKSIKGMTYKILFWEDNSHIENFIKLNFPNRKYEKSVAYKKGNTPGVIFFEDEILDISFLKQLLINHFNFEMAQDPALNLRVQICINLEVSIMLLDIYDDRGFDIYFIRHIGTVI